MVSSNAAGAGGTPPLAERTLPTVLERNLRVRPDAPALRDPGRALTHGQVHEHARVLAGGLARHGAGPGRPVLLMLDNHLDHALSWLGLALLGALEVPVNTAYLGNQLAHLVGDSGAELMVVEDRYCERLAAVADRLPGLRTVLVRGGPGAALGSADGPGPGRWRVVPFEDLLDAGPADPVAARPWDLTGIMYTSGTTGPSKGVLVTHAHAYGYSDPVAWGMPEPSGTNMVTLPLFHIGGQWAGIYNALIAGAGAVVLDRFHPSSYLDDVRRHGTTNTLLLGAMAAFLYRQPPRPDDADNPMERVMMVPVIPEVAEFADRFGMAVGTAYGSTEGSSSMFGAPGEARPGACGRVRDGFEARVVDENDIEVPTGEVGELVVRTREPWTLMAGYHGRPEATVAAWRNQWLHTGDAMRVDEHGVHHFVDRISDALRRRGENISSFEVEAAVDEHPAVLESAAVGVRSEDTEDEILVVVALRPGASCDGAELCAFLAERVPYFMVPRYVRFVEALPKTPTEKVRKQELRATGVTAATWDRAAAGVAPPRWGRIRSG